ncbi:dihydrolipoyl dehydrogenase [Novibacillus thermophilus]|uniref:Dihydrolipoyl dehydrogenase n=1 Tax=Novibacillus thermophilus TaxID=1471761 RepID=A0A1U9K4H3_9BACL|nr:dihydrolipoyl dehydrogenase [Novibacillus thermophilus]AQS54928.1 dihydrolipoyl dehydrogenase [Novibacillus thermophilus]
MVVGDFANEVDVLVVGGGPGGYVAAIRAAQLGRDVTLVEKGALGGVCLNVGCIPSKALISAAELAERMKQAGNMGVVAENVSVDFLKMQEWKNGVVKQLTKGVGQLLKSNKITVVQGEAYFSGTDQVRVATEESSETYKFNDCIVATGSSSAELKALPFDGERIISSTEALNLQQVPKNMIVVGGGYIGLELGTAYAKLGSDVTILEGMDQLLPGTDPKVVRIITKNLKKQKVTFKTNAFVKKADVHGDSVTVTADVKGEEQTFTADVVLVSVGRHPNTSDLGLEQIGVELDDKGFVKVNEKMQTNVDHIYAIGDITGPPMLAHKASYEGKVAAEVIAGEASAVDYRAMPYVVFSDPEIAYTGLSEEEAKAEGYDVTSFRFPFPANGRALSMNAADGFVNVVADRETQRILGVQIVGPEASSLIAEAVMAIEFGATAEDIALTIHAHPTLPEVIQEAAEGILGHAIHTANR